MSRIKKRKWYPSQNYKTIIDKDTIRAKDFIDKKEYKIDIDLPKVMSESQDQKDIKDKIKRE